MNTVWAWYTVTTVKTSDNGRAESCDTQQLRIFPTQMWLLSWPWSGRAGMGYKLPIDPLKLIIQPAPSLLPPGQINAPSPWSQIYGRSQNMTSMPIFHVMRMKESSSKPVGCLYMAKFGSAWPTPQFSLFSRAGRRGQPLCLSFFPPTLV
jgi:hypothetical protein